MLTDQFWRAASLSKCVETKSGPGILVGRDVIHVQGPDGVDWTDKICQVLKLTGRRALLRTDEEQEEQEE